MQLTYQGNGLGEQLEESDVLGRNTQHKWFLKEGRLGVAALREAFYSEQKAFRPGHPKGAQPVPHPGFENQ